VGQRTLPALHAERATHAFIPILQVFLCAHRVMRRISLRVSIDFTPDRRRGLRRLTQPLHCCLLQTNEARSARCFTFESKRHSCCDAQACLLRRVAFRVISRGLSIHPASLWNCLALLDEFSDETYLTNYGLLAA
jgi:hypothetical protein